MTFRVIFLSLFICLFAMVAHGEQHNFPFIAEVTADSVNVRAGQSANFEKLCELTKGDEIYVVGQNFSWYKIKLPTVAKSFISGKFVNVLEEELGEVTGSRINIRAGAGINYTVLGQLNRDDYVKILKISGDWIQIEPTDGLHGYISKDLIAFKTKDTSGYRASHISELAKKRKEAEEKKRLAEQQKREALARQKAEEKERKRKEEERKRIEEERKKRLVKAKGVLKKVRDAANNLRYQLIIDDQSSYYIQGFEKWLDRFLQYKVEVDGLIQKAQHDEQYSYPVVKISQIQLVF